MTGPAISATRSLIELSPENVAQHPDNLRDPGRDLTALTASVKAVGVLVPLIVVPVAAVPGREFDPAVTHVAVDGNRRRAAARAAGLPLPCEVRPDLASARHTAVTMAVTGLVRDGLTAPMKPEPSRRCWTSGSAPPRSAAPPAAAGRRSVSPARPRP